MKTLLSSALVVAVLIAHPSFASAAESHAPAPPKPAEFAQHLADFQRAELEAQTRKLNFSRLVREQDRLKARQAAAEKSLLDLQSKLASKFQSSDAKEAAELGAAVKAAEKELAHIDSELQAAAERRLMEAQGSVPERVIIAGDVLVLTMDEGSFNGLYAVRKGGYVILPRIGRLYVAGKLPAEIKQSIETAMAGAHISPAGLGVGRILLPQSESATLQIFLAGEFTKSGAITLPATDASVMTAIIQAGGFTGTADGMHVKLMRSVAGKSLVEEINAQSVLDGAGLTTDLAVVSGDIISVQSFSPTVSLTGNVARPGGVKLEAQDELGAFAAIVRNGGFAKLASLEQAYVLRDYGNGEKHRIPVNMRDVQAGKVPDVVLRGKDIVVVPETK